MCGEGWHTLPRNVRRYWRRPVRLIPREGVVLDVVGVGVFRRR